MALIFVDLDHRNAKTLGKSYQIFSFFLQNIIPRTTSRITTKTDVTDPAMMEVLEVFVRGVFAWMLADVVLYVRSVFTWTLLDLVILNLLEIKISTRNICYNNIMN